MLWEYDSNWTSTTDFSPAEKKRTPWAKKKARDPRKSFTMLEAHGPKENTAKDPRKEMILSMKKDKYRKRICLTVAT